MKNLLFFLTLLFASSLFADQLTTDPPIIWDTECATCLPRCPCLPPPSPFLPVFDKDNPEEEVSLDLLNPLYEDGVISTNEGGVLSGRFLRIQAKKIVYTRRLEGPNPVFTVYCEGDLLIDYKERVFVGESLYYDFLSHSGKITCGKMAAFPWFLGGQEILLCEAGDIVIHNGYVTTSEGGEKEVMVLAPEIKVTKDLIVTGTDVTFRIKDIPVLWIPKGGVDIKHTNRSPLGFNFGWNGFLGTHFGVRYHFLTLGAFKGYARADGYIGRGLGVGFESEYDPKCSPTEFYTRNYFAHDLSINDRFKKDRYRVQGSYYSEFLENTTSLEFIYDFVSDAQMAADYETHDFELNPAQRTELTLRKQAEFWIANLHARARVNRFQTVNQQLPSFEMSLHPFEISNSGIIAENLFKVGFLDYSFSDDIKGRDFHSGRFEVRPRLYRPFPFRFLKVTPEARLIGIAYSNSPHHKAVGQALADLGTTVDTTLTRFIGPLKHTMIPYIDYHYLTAPRSALKDHYLFTIDDAYHRLSLMRFGMRHLLFLAPSPCWLSPLRIDIWANAFFGAKPIPQTIQKGYLNLDWQPHPKLFWGMESSWNFEEHLLDFINNRVEWTVNENIALAGEYRHRSPFAWRKNDFYNFLLDAVRDQNALLASPLSDRRDTILGRLFCRVTPSTALRLEIRNGWNRKDPFQPHYTEYHVELESLIFQHWRLFFSYEKREEDNRYSIALKLDPGPPSKRKARFARF